MQVPEEVVRRLRKQGYYIVGRHSAVKLCHWTKVMLKGGKPCYKGTFYGIQSHRCLQMTPALFNCNLNCLYCWRMHNFVDAVVEDPDDPAFIVEESIKGQRVLLSGYKGNPKVPRRLWEESQEPRHMAISLTGEPTLYPRLGELIEEAHKRGMTTFLVTNGTTPEVLRDLDPLPTQLYVTVAAPNEEVFRKLQLPPRPGLWQKLMETLELLPSLDTRITIRHTLVEGWNLGYVDEYAKLDEKADPDFIEPKGYMYVGWSRLRLRAENMPTHERIMWFARELAERLGYRIYAERPESRVAMLTKHEDESKIKLRPR